MPEREYQPVNQETDPDYNQEPGIVLTPGSPYLKELAKFEQFHSRFTHGTAGPGNPYVKREYPKMMYRARRHKGNLLCMAPQPDPLTSKDPAVTAREQELASRFTRENQRVVKDESEQQRAFEGGWRLSPQEALDAAHEREDVIARETAHRNYDDRKLSDAAKAEAATQIRQHGGEHQPEIHESHVESPTERIVYCTGTKRDGGKCSRKAKPGTDRCGKHPKAA